MMRSTISSKWLHECAARAAATRALPYVLLGLAMVGYVLAVWAFT